MSISEGTRLGPYTIIEQVGQGGMATVYKAFHAAMQRHVALKVLPKELAKEPGYMGRFEQEARLLANLEHPHLLPVYDFGSHEDYTYLVMRMLPGGTLKDLIYRGPLAIREIDRIFTQVAEGLSYAHKNGVVHRDVKPSNVMIDQHGWAFLTDFGIAKLIEGSSQFTMSGMMVGTPAYMAPEQVSGIPADARADVYALSIVLFELITGQVPFQAETPMAVALKHLQEPLPLPKTLVPQLPEDVQDVLLKGLAKNVIDRYQSVDDLLAAWHLAIGDMAKINVPFGGLGAALNLTPSVTADTVIGSQVYVATDSRAGMATQIESPQARPPQEPPASTAPVSKPTKSRGLPILPLALVGGAGLLFVLMVIVIGAAWALNRNATGVANGGNPTADGNATSVSGEVLPPTPTNLPQPPIDAGDGPDLRALASSVQHFSNWNTATHLAVVDGVLWSAGAGGVTIWRDPDNPIHIGVGEGLPNQSILAMLANPNVPGEVWLGTENGVIRVGANQEITYFTREDGLASSYVSALAWLPDSLGGGLVAATAGETPALSVYTERQGWQLLNGPFNATDPADPNALTNSFRVLAVIDSGLLVVASEDGLAAYDGTDWRVFKDAPGMTSNLVLAVAEMTFERLLLGTDAGAMIFDGATFTPIEGAGTDSFTSVLQAQNGDLWFGTSYGPVVQAVTDTGEFIRYDEVGALGENALTAILETEAGVLIFGTPDNGLVRFAEGQFSAVQAQQGLPLTSVVDILPIPDLDGREAVLLVDYVGNSVVLLPGDGSFLAGPELPRYVRPAGVGPNGGLWGVSDTDGVFVLPQLNGQGRFLGVGAGLPSETATAVTFGQEQAWVGTDQGVYVISAEVGGTFTAALSGLPPERVTRLFTASDESVWVVQANGVARYLPTGETQFWLVGDGPWPFREVSEIWSIAENEVGDLWFGVRSGGLLRYQPGLDQWSFDLEPLPGTALTAISFSPSGHPWVGGYYGGLWVRNSQGWRVAAPPIALQHENVWVTYIDRQGRLWVGTDGGLAVFPTENP